MKYSTFIQLVIINNDFLQYRYIEEDDILSPEIYESNFKLFKHAFIHCNLYLIEQMLKILKSCNFQKYNDFVCDIRSSEKFMKIIHILELLYEKELFFINGQMCIDLLFFAEKMSLTQYFPIIKKLFINPLINSPRILNNFFNSLFNHCKTKNNIMLICITFENVPIKSFLKKHYESGFIENEYFSQDDFYEGHGILEYLESFVKLENSDAISIFKTVCNFCYNKKCVAKILLYLIQNFDIPRNIIIYETQYPEIVQPILSAYNFKVKWINYKKRKTSLDEDEDEDDKFLSRNQRNQRNQPIDEISILFDKM